MCIVPVKMCVNAKEFTDKINKRFCILMKLCSLYISSLTLHQLWGKSIKRCVTLWFKAIVLDIFFFLLRYNLILIFIPYQFYLKEIVVRQMAVKIHFNFSIICRKVLVFSSIYYHCSCSMVITFAIHIFMHKIFIFIFFLALFYGVL